jgi:hypothetical protein
MRRHPCGTQESRSEAAPYQVRLPGFISEETVGLGDVIKKATAAVGITPCAGCARRADLLNRWVTFTGRTR